MTHLAYDRAGSGPPLVLIHPLGAWRGVWKPVLPLLTPHFDVVAVDMPGFGDSPDLPPGEDAGAATIAETVRDTLAGLGIERAHAAGISLGVWTALEFGKTGAALSVTAIAAAGFWRRALGPRPEVGRTTTRAILPLMRPLLRTEAGRRATFAGIMLHGERVPADEAWQLVRHYARATGSSRANAAMRASLFSGFEDVRVPITMAWADHDRSVYPPPSVPSQVVTTGLHDCGHVGTWDAPDQVAEVIREGAGRALASAA